MKLYTGRHRGDAAGLAQTEMRRLERAQERRVVELIETGERADWSPRA